MPWLTVYITISKTGGKVEQSGMIVVVGREVVILVVVGVVVVGVVVGRKVVVVGVVVGECGLCSD